MNIQEILILEDKHGLFEKDEILLQYTLDDLIEIDCFDTFYHFLLDYCNLYLDSQNVENYAYLTNEMKVKRLESLSSECSPEFINTLFRVISSRFVIDEFDQFDDDEALLLMRVQDFFGKTKFHDFHLLSEMSRIGQLLMDNGLAWYQNQINIYRDL